MAGGIASEFYGQRKYTVEKEKKQGFAILNIMKKIIHKKPIFPTDSLDFFRGQEMEQSSPDDLVYAASARCICGAGMAYDFKKRTQRYWCCSTVLLGRARSEEIHTDPLHYVQYKIIAENQPGAFGKTTRPKEEKPSA